MKTLILFVAVRVPAPADYGWTDTSRATRGIHSLEMLIWMILLIGIGLPKFALANCEGTGPCYCTPGTAVCTNTPPPNNSSGGSGSSGGYTPQQQILLQGAAIMGNAIGQSLRGNPEEDARLQAEQAAEAKRQAEIQDQKNEEAKNRLLGNSQGGDASSGLSLMGAQPNPSSGLTLMEVEHSPGLQLMTGNESISPPAGMNAPNNAATSVKHSGAFNKGFQDAIQCYSQNAGSRCAGISGDQWRACLSDYRSGYQVGDKQQQQAMDEATRIGQSAGAGGLLANAASDPRALGPCRTQWIEAYNRGYFQGTQAKNTH